jgi:hypothetical protein
MLLEGGKLYLYSDNLIKKDYYFVGVFEVIDHELRVNQSDKMQRKNSILFKLKKISNDEDFHKTHITNIKNKSNDEMKCYLQKINEEFSNE